MRNIERMRDAFCEVMRHTDTMEALREGVSGSFGVRRAVAAIENLWRIMLLDMQSRAHAKLTPQKVRRLHNRFLRDVGPVVAQIRKGREGFEDLYKSIVELPYIGPKIASVFLRQMACQYRILPWLKAYLFLPVDTHIKTILVKRLRAVNKREISNGNPLESPKARRFQESLSRLPWLGGRWHRADLDAFWFVGYLFCSKNSGTVCSEICWIREYCCQRNR